MSGVRALGLFAACAALFVWLAIEHPLGTRLVVVAVFVVWALSRLAKRLCLHPPMTDHLRPSEDERLLLNRQEAKP